MFINTTEYYNNKFFFLLHCSAHTQYYGLKATVCLQFNFDLLCVVTECDVYRKFTWFSC